MTENLAKIIQFPIRDEVLIRASSHIIHDALQTVTECYGDGLDPALQQMAVRPLQYHNTSHSVDVYTRAMAMAAYIGLPRVDQAVTGMAAASHDIIQEGGRAVMEARSADWLVGEMAKSSFTEAQQTAGRLAILGTEPLFTAGALTGQKVSQLEFPSETASQIAHSVACADMGGIYMPAGPSMSRKLFQEIHQTDLNKPFPAADLLEFQDMQLSLLETFQFSHPAGEELFGDLRSDVIGHEGFVTDAISIGQIASWQDLNAADRWFATQFRGRK